MTKAEIITKQREVIKHYEIMESTKLTDAAACVSAIRAQIDAVRQMVPSILADENLLNDTLEL